MNNAIQDRLAIVTGAGQGLGRAIALRLAQAGADVVVADIEATSAQETAAAIQRLGRRSVARQMDVGNTEDIRALVSETLTAFGRIDILINNAGVTRTADFFEVTPEDWDHINRVNARGLFFCLQAVARTMADRRSGRIINIASIAGKGYRHTANIAYAASKGAVIAITQIAAQVLAAHNINVNAICPGLTSTEMLHQIRKIRAAKSGETVEVLEKRAAESIPLGRTNTPDDIAAMALFLASDESRNITGQAINVDGGLVLH